MYKQIFCSEEAVGKTIQAFESILHECRDRYIVSFTDETFIFLTTESHYDGDSDVCLTDEFAVAEHASAALKAGIVTKDEMDALLAKKEEDRVNYENWLKNHELAKAKELLRKSGCQIVDQQT